MNSVISTIDEFKFQRHLPLMNSGGSTGIKVAGVPDPAVVLALANPAGMLPAADLELADLTLEAATPNPIEFGRGADKISFTAQASAFAGFGAYHTGAALLAKLGQRPGASEPSSDIGLSPDEFGDLQASLLSVVRWGFSASGKGSGAMALGAVGQATLAISGNTEGLFAVISRQPQAQPARRTVQNTIDSWILPRQITAIDQIDPGTWIVAEVIGSLSVTVGAQLGYSYNWVREARLGGLAGDIGLRLQTAVNAAVGFSASGRCAVVVSRDSDAKRVRLRLFKLKSREFDVTLDAGVGVTADLDSLAPAKGDDFVAAVFDTHGQQILRDLRVLEKWTDPTVPLSELLADAGVSGAEKLIARMAGVSPDRLPQEFDKVKGTATAFISNWHALPAGVSSMLLKLVEERVDLDTVRSAAVKLATIGGQKLGEMLEGELSRADSFHSPVGRVLESVSDRGGVLGLLQKPIGEVQKIGQQIAAVLDGSVLEGVLMNFQAYLETELQVTAAAAKPATETEFAGLDPLLKGRLAAFLGVDALALPDLDKVRQAVSLLLEKRQDYYEKSLAALQNQYTADLTAAYECSSTTQALVDATFDFSQDAANVARIFQDAVQGKCDTLFTVPHPQISIGTATLSHGIRRQARVDVTLPFLKAFESHLNIATAKITARDGGVLFSLQASDTVASNQRRSILSLAVNLALDRPQSAAVRVHDAAIETNYTLLFAKRKMRIADVRSQIAPAVRTYFASRIPDLEAFLRFVDQRTEAVIPNGANLLGDGLISLQLTLSAQAAARAGRAWLSLPADHRAPVYQTLSKAIQDSLKRHIHDARFTTAESYTVLGSTELVLAYCALAPAAAPARSAADLPYWESTDPARQRELLASADTVRRMQALLTRAQEVLNGDHMAQFLRPGDAATILRNAANTLQNRQNPVHAIFDGLLFAEAQVVKHAFDAGLKIGAFSAAAGASPADAIAALAVFGSKLTEAFNADVTSILGPGMRALGTQVFLDVAAAIVPAAAADLKETNALLSLEFLKAGAAFDADALLAAGEVDEASRAVADRVVQVA